MGGEARTEVPGFRIVRELGRGAMGVVYLAEELALGRTVALKLLRAAGEETGELRARFEREVKATARIQHPNVIPIHSTGEAGGHLWYAMPFVEGRSLDRVLAESPQGRLTAARAARIAREVALSLAAAHAAGVVHRDVKPGNLMLLAQPAPDVAASGAGRREQASWVRAGDGSPPVVDRPLLVDFGLALEVGAAQLSRSGLLVGTPSQMAPEQFRGRPEDVGPAADQWGLGVVLYECLTGRLPFPAADLPTLARTVCEVPAVPPSRLEPSIDRDLDTVVLKCLEKDAEDRYPSCEALAEDLGRWLREAPVRARPPGLLRRLRTWSRHHPVRATAGALLLVGLAGVGVTAVALRVARAARVRDVALGAGLLEAGGDLAGASEAFDEWIALEPGAGEPREGRERVQALRRVREAEARFREARERMAEVRDAQARVDLLRGQALRGRGAPGGSGLGSEEARGSEPWWMREPAHRAAVEARREGERAVRRRAELADLLAVSRSLVEAAHERAGPEGARVRRAILEGSAAWHMEEWRRAVAAGDAEEAEGHRLAVRRLHPGPYEAELEGDGALRVEGLEAATRAWLFRWVREDEAVPRGGPRLVPLPYDRIRRAVRVPEAYARHAAERLRGEDPAAVEPDTATVTEPFPGTETHLGTMAGPLARERYAALLSGSALPLDAPDAEAIATPDGAAEVGLPMGSYLLLLRAPGRAETRLPFAVGRGERVRLAPEPLPAEGSVPPGFVRVTGGRTVLGTGDPRAIDGPPPGVEEVEAFLAGRFEVTSGEWWEFLNDPRTLAEIAAHRERGLRFVPRIDGQALVEPDPEGRYGLGAWPPEVPVSSVSLFDVAGYVEPPPAEDLPRDDQLQALAALLRRSRTAGWGYLAWRTERSRARAARAAAGGPVEGDVAVAPGPDGRPVYSALLFSLPTQAEWQRMARGGDGRALVYGDDREWLAFKGARSRRSNPAPEPVGLFVEDESPFGVRDLAGSVSEWTAEWKEVGGLFRVKGGSWGSPDPEEDRIDSRRTLPPHEVEPTVGFRVVVRAMESAR